MDTLIINIFQKHFQWLTINFIQVPQNAHPHHTRGTIPTCLSTTFIIFSGFIYLYRQNITSRPLIIKALIYHTCDLPYFILQIKYTNRLQHEEYLNRFIDNETPKEHKYLKLIYFSK